jgi:hypothetical protein
MKKLYFLLIVVVTTTALLAFKGINKYIDIFKDLGISQS